MKRDFIDTEAVISSFKSGDERALTYLYDQYYARIRFFINDIVKNDQEAEDITIQSFTKLWERHQQFETLPAVRSFLYITARNAAFDFLRREKKGTSAEKELTYLMDDADEDMERRIIKAEFLQNAYAEIEKLPTQSRRIIKMLFLEGLKPAQIAAQLGIDVHTVSTQKAYALKLLKRKLLTVAFLLYCINTIYIS